MTRPHHFSHFLSNVTTVRQQLSTGFNLFLKDKVPHFALFINVKAIYSNSDGCMSQSHCLFKTLVWNQGNIMEHHLTGRFYGSDLEFRRKLCFRFFFNFHTKSALHCLAGNASRSVAYSVCFEMWTWNKKIKYLLQLFIWCIKIWKPRSSWILLDISEVSESYL